ncbi:MAG: arylsulfatase [Bacteroides sp.]|nr:arylsulfatase [Bacteroides sp.]
MRKAFLFFLFVACISCSTEEELPNILLIYVDDLGYGDLSSYNSNSRIHTPNIDHLAGEGIMFMDAHAPAAICGPSRYGLLTGRYSWRKADGLSNGTTFENLRISRQRPTLATMLKEKGYNTAQIGKWGLRHNYEDALKEGEEISGDLTFSSFDFPEKKLNGSSLVGFDYSWVMTWLSKDKGAKYAFENGLPHDPEFKDYDPHDWLPDATQKAVEYLQAYAGKKDYTPFQIDRKRPFFLYWDPPTPHEPIVPNNQFSGTSEAGDYGDFVVELDHEVGRILKALDENGLSKNTLVIFSSDNGPESIAYSRVQEYRHYSMGDWRGVKRDLYEGGTRVPFILRWPGKIQAGSVKDEPICLIDIFASLAELSGYKLPENAGEDSQSFLPLLLDQEYQVASPKPIVYHTHKGRFALREGNMLYVDAETGSQSKEPEWFYKERKVQAHGLSSELFDLSSDPQQLVNIAEENPEMVQEMKTGLEKIKAKKQIPQ